MSWVYIAALINNIRINNKIFSFINIFHSFIYIIKQKNNAIK